MHRIKIQAIELYADGMSRSRACFGHSARHCLRGNNAGKWPVLRGNKPGFMPSEGRYEGIPAPLEEGAYLPAGEPFEAVFADSNHTRVIWMVL